jgi:Alw26I/Eco31I/Esp3I family type II restriction endonuclease
MDVHKKFKDYMNFIVKHQNYVDLPFKYNSKKEITWVKTGKNCPERTQWWDNKIKELNVASRSDVAREIHPKELKGLKPCHVCGESLSIFYIYPSCNTLKMLNKLNPHKQFTIYCETIFEIIDILCENDNNQLKVIAKYFDMKDLPKNKDELKSFIDINYVKESKSGKLSPGVMSNAPDRLDGFHTYNACCRSIKDTGRHKDNMATYTRDRRAYECWAAGDFVLANAIMGQFNSHKNTYKCVGCNKTTKQTADHVGPISLGFSHRAEFQPLCKKCNSSKNNRMTYKDIITLLEDEGKGIEVVTWHSKYIWDKLKNLVDNNQKAELLSSIMRKNIHHILTIFSGINKRINGRNFLLKFLNPSFCNSKYSIYNFSPVNLANIKIIDKEPLDKEQLDEIKNDTNSITIVKAFSEALTKEKSKEDYLRISFDSLKEYEEKTNRKVQDEYLKENEEEIKTLFSLIEASKFDDAQEKLNNLLDCIASQFEIDFKKSSI